MLFCLRGHYRLFCDFVLEATIANSIQVVSLKWQIPSGHALTGDEGYDHTLAEDECFDHTLTEDKVDDDGDDNDDHTLTEDKVYDNTLTEDKGLDHTLTEDKGYDHTLTEDKGFYHTLTEDGSYDHISQLALLTLPLALQAVSSTFVGPLGTFSCKKSLSPILKYV